MADTLGRVTSRPASTRPSTGAEVELSVDALPRAHAAQQSVVDLRPQLAPHQHPRTDRDDEDGDRDRTRGERSDARPEAHLAALIW